MMRNEFNYEGANILCNDAALKDGRLRIEVKASNYPGVDCRGLSASAIAVHSRSFVLTTRDARRDHSNLHFSQSSFLVSIPASIILCNFVKEIADLNSSAALSSQAVSFSSRLTTHQHRHHRNLLSPPRRWVKRLQKSRLQIYSQYYEPMHPMMPKSTKSTMSSPVSSKTMYRKPASYLFLKPRESR